MIILSGLTNIVISTSRNQNKEYDIFFINDISLKSVEVSLSPSTYNSRYMEFIIDVIDLYIEKGYGKIMIKDEDEEIYNDIYFNEFEDKDELKYASKEKKFVYHKK